VLYYQQQQQQQLIGFLSVFFFYDNACELTLMVDPAFRRQHIASQLIATILPVIQSRFLEHVICPSPKGLNDAWLSARGFIYQNSEVRMQWLGPRLAPCNHPELTFRRATGEDVIPLLIEIDMTCFHSEKRDIEPTYLRLVGDEAYALLIVSKNQHVIGKAHVHREANQIIVSDIAILPDYQGHGYGQALVAYCIDYARATRDLPLRLDVEADNDNAVHIYDKLGFKTINIYDRWMISAHASS
jgi:ribosomal protein S18 acetylase RimI-like enzyme